MTGTEYMRKLEAKVLSDDIFKMLQHKNYDAGIATAALCRTIHKIVRSAPTPEHGKKLAAAALDYIKGDVGNEFKDDAH